jgi:hypothetical protein
MLDVLIMLHVAEKRSRQQRIYADAIVSPLKRLLRRACGISQSQQGDHFVKFKLLFASVIIASIATPIAAQAQGVPGGFVHGVYEGNRRAGPIGAVVGGAVGGVIGGIEGVLGVDHAYRYPEERVERPRRIVHKRVRHARRHVHHTS